MIGDSIISRRRRICLMAMSLRIVPQDWQIPHKARRIRRPICQRADSAVHILYLGFSLPFNVKLDHLLCVGRFGRERICSSCHSGIPLGLRTFLLIPRRDPGWQDLGWLAVLSLSAEWNPWPRPSILCLPSLLPDQMEVKRVSLPKLPHSRLPRKQPLACCLSLVQQGNNVLLYDY